MEAKRMIDQILETDNDNTLHDQQQESLEKRGAQEGHHHELTPPTSPFSQGENSIASLKETDIPAEDDDDPPPVPEALRRAIQQSRNKTTATHIQRETSPDQAKPTSPRSSPSLDEKATSLQEKTLPEATDRRSPSAPSDLDKVSIATAEEAWRRRMFKSLRLTRSTEHRKAISAALLAVRKTSGWRIAGLRMKIAMNEMEIEALDQRRAARVKVADVVRYGVVVEQKPAGGRSAGRSGDVVERGEERRVKRRRLCTGAVGVVSGGIGGEEEEEEVKQFLGDEGMVVGEGDKSKFKRRVTGRLRDFTKPYDEPVETVETATGRLPG